VVVAVGENVLHHVKRRGNCPDWGNVRGGHVRGENVQWECLTLDWPQVWYFLPVRYTVRPCAHHILKTNELISMQNGARGPRENGIKRSTSGSGDQRTKSQEAEVSVGGPAEASFSTSWGRVGILVLQ